MNTTNQLWPAGYAGVSRPSVSTAAFIAAGLLCAVAGCSAANFAVPQKDLTQPVIVIAYGDMRFTDPSNDSATDPKIRKWLVDKIAAERPAALLVSGDVPWHGDDLNDYAVFRTETESWRTAGLRVYPALGNHELNGDEVKDLDNWWSAFPELRPRRWYSVQLGDFIYILNADSNSPLTPGSDQDRWLRHELNSLPASVQFVFLTLHHPLVSDYQANGDASHNIRPNEAALAETLNRLQARSRAHFIVNAGHVHNYERFSQHGVTYLVSGGGGAKPLPIIRTRADLYQASGFPNYHYVKFVIRGSSAHAVMVRVEDPEGTSPVWREADTFEIGKGPRK